MKAHIEKMELKIPIYGRHHGNDLRKRLGCLCLLALNELPYCVPVNFLP